MIILRTIGYIINSLLLFIAIISIVRLVMDSYILDIKELPVGPLVEELTDIIMEHGKKFIPINSPKNLLISITIVSLILFIVIRAVVLV